MVFFSVVCTDSSVHETVYTVPKQVETISDQGIILISYVSSLFLRGLSYTCNKLYMIAKLIEKKMFTLIGIWIKFTNHIVKLLKIGLRT